MTRRQYINAAFAILLSVAGLTTTLHVAQAAAEWMEATE